MVIQSLLLYADWGYLVLRLALGLVFIVHGWPKLRALKDTAGNFAMMGFKPGMFWGTIAALVEFFGGLALFLGFYTQIAAVLLAVQMLVALLWKLSRGQSFIGGYELDLILLASAITVATLGPGVYSLDFRILGLL